MTLRSANSPVAGDSAMAGPAPTLHAIVFAPAPSPKPKQKQRPKKVKVGAGSDLEPQSPPSPPRPAMKRPRTSGALERFGFVTGKNTQGSEPVSEQGKKSAPPQTASDQEAGPPSPDAEHSKNNSQKSGTQVLSDLDL